MIIEGNCIDVMKTFEEESIDLCIADPPYLGVLSEEWDNNISNYEEFSRMWLREVKRLLKPNGSIYVWCSIGPKSSSLLDIAKILKEEWVFQDMVVWAKQRGRGNRAGWLFTREEVLWATKTKKYNWNRDFQYSTVKYHESWIQRLGKQDNPYKRSKNVWTDINEVTIEMAKESGGRGNRKPLHAAQKPLVAIDRIILAHTKENDLVLDPFAGSGTTGVSAKRLGRKYILIEQNADYIEIIKNRISKESCHN